MSVHAMIAAAYVEDLTPGTKLVLMAVADSADEHTLEAAPGLPKLRAWSGLGRSQTLAVVADLCQPIPDVRPRYLEHIAKGRIGRRAVYRVFPDGLPSIPHPDEVAARYTASSTPVDNPGKEGPADWTLNLGEGPISPQEGPAQTGPLHAVTSVSSASVPKAPRRRPVDNTGFPGARTDDRDPRTRRGFHDQPCPIHPDQIVPCGRCAHAAVNSDPAAIADAKARARAAARRHRPTTEEPVS